MARLFTSRRKHAAASEGVIFVLGGIVDAVHLRRAAADSCGICSISYCHSCLLLLDLRLIAYELERTHPDADPIRGAPVASDAQLAKLERQPDSIVKAIALWIDASAIAQLTAQLVTLTQWQCDLQQECQVAVVHAYHAAA